MSKTNTVELIRPDLAAEWHLELNGDLTPSEVVSSFKSFTSSINDYHYSNFLSLPALDRFISEVQRRR